ncbi:MAG4270 family putative restriction endonuclease [Mycoplasmopsis opalescens]|uniref:MAG4270 family putative restriction endonuclease n=1 Tax=Mycoplasmopsis opalescens TaxID=114886 RepID=UPI0004A70418|nr:HNH endonuclease [Mycoplasmopsis opalescens]
MLPKDISLTLFKFKIFSKPNAKQKIDAILHCYFDENGLLVQYKIDFLPGTMIDLYTTDSWFKKQTSTYKEREQIFNLLWPDKSQLSRPTLSSKKLHELNDIELDRINTYFYKYYKGTINNIIGVLKGNNPTGSYMNPKSSELKSNSVFFENNLIMLLDLLRVKDRVPDECILNTSEKNIDEFRSFLQGTIVWDIIFDFVAQLEKTKQSANDPREVEKLKTLKSALDKTMSIYRNYVSNVKEDIKKYRVIARKNKDKIKYFPFSKTSVEVAHIYPVSAIKRKIIQLFKNAEYLKYEIMVNDPEYKKLIEQIADVNNLMTLEPTIHTEYDNKKFYWDPEDGEVNIIAPERIDNELVMKLNSYKIDTLNNPEIKKYLIEYKKLISNNL